MRRSGSAASASSGKARSRGMIGWAMHRLDGWLVVLGSACLIGWSLLAVYGPDLALPAFCSSERWAVPLSASFDLALVFNSPPQLAIGWLLMLTAMMSPQLIAPLRHIRERSFSKRRTRAMLLFVIGYIAVWMAA